MLLSYAWFSVIIFSLLMSVSRANKTFIATESWKTIEEGDVVPPGLHFRINLETGKKEAKLLETADDKSEKESSLIAIENKPTDPEELKRILKNIKNDDRTSENNLNNKEIHFRTYEELKKEFQDVQMHIRIEAEVVQQFVNEFITLKNLSHPDDSERAESILQIFETLLHHYDNAVEFARVDGISQVIIPALNTTGQTSLRILALSVLGSAAQSNPQVQLSAFNAGCITSLLKLLALETEPTLINRGIFALSCLIRNFPSSQLNFIKEGGISVLSRLFDRHTKGNTRLRISRLLTDLLQELEENTNSPQRKEKYDLINLDLDLRDHGWCNRSSGWLCDQVPWEVMVDLLEDDVDHEVIDVAVSLLQSLSDSCLDDFVTNIDLMNVVNHVKQFYVDLALREMDDGMGDSLYSDIHSKLQRFAATLARTTVFRDEL